MHYVTDTKEIRDAKEKYAEAQENIQIAGLDKEISGLNDIIDDLDKKIEESNEYYDKLIEETEKYWDSLIKGLEEYRSRWKELTNIEEQAKMKIALEELGITTDDVLSMSESAFESFKGTYLGLLKEMYAGNDDMIGMLQNFGGISTDTLTPLSGTINDVADSLDNFAGSTSNVNANISETASGVKTVADNADTLKNNIGEINELVTDEQTSFENLRQKIEQVIEAINQKTEAVKEEQNAVEIATNDEIAALLLLKEKILEIMECLEAIDNTVDTFDATSVNNLTDAFQLLYDKLILVSTALGTGMEGQADGTMNSIVSAIQALNDISLQDGIIAQFIDLKDAIDNVTNAISGGDLSSGSNGDAASSSSPSMSAGAGGSDSLTGAITSMGETSQETLGETGGDGVIGKFEEFSGVIADAEGHTQGIIDKMNELDGMTAECTIRVNVETNGSIPAFAEGTLNTDFEGGEFTAQYGKAFAEGTGKYQGLPKAEKNALVSEYGQIEMTVLPNGDTIMTDEPTLMDLPKDTVIYNEEQTKKIMDNKVDVSGKGHAGGTTDNSVVPAKYVAQDIYPEMDLWERMERCAAAMGRTMEDMLLPLNSIAIDIKKETGMGRFLSTVNNVSNISNNNKPSVTIGDINVVCPGVTEKEVAEYIPGLLSKELNRTFSGFSNYTDQWSRT